MRKINPIGFISEHTAEFYLLPSVLRECKKQHIDVTPLYFWSNREGSRVGIESAHDRKARVALVYPRRPKVKHAGDNQLLIKFNRALFESAQIAAQFNFPVFAGAPLVSSIYDLCEDTPCIWFWLNQDGSCAEDIILSIDIANCHVENANHDLIKPLTEKELISDIFANTEISSWAECVEKLRMFKRRFPGSRYGYKPFYLLFFETNIT